MTKPKTEVDLSATYPELAKQWHPTKNIGLKNKKGEDISTPDKITANSHQRVWWYLPYDVPINYPVEHLRGKHFDFEWEAVVSSRTRGGYGCPYLSGKSVWKGFNDLETINPELAREWDYEANEGLKDKFGRDISSPDKITADSGQIVGWKLPYEVPKDYPVEHLRGKFFVFKWKANVGSRSDGKGCPYLSGQAVWKGFNDLTTVNPKVASEWDYEANKGLRDKFGRDISVPDKIAANSGQIAGWKLSYDVPMDYHIEHLRGKHFDFKWKSEVKGRNNRMGCPYLSGNEAWKGFNDLETVNPELATEWDYEANKGLKDAHGKDISTPDKVTAGSEQKVHWKLPYDVPMDYPIERLRGKHFDFKWECMVESRSKGVGCPYLSGQAVWKGFNDLETINSELASEWDYEANKGLKDERGRDISTPNKVTTYSQQKVGWICNCTDKDTGESVVYKWKAKVANRSMGEGCPFIFDNKGEKAVRKILKFLNINFEEQYKFKDRFYASNKYPLKDDFAIFDKNSKVVATIEFHGQQHYEPVDFAGKGKEWAKEEFKKNQERDRIKTNYLKTHGIKQLIIPYWELDNVEQIVKNFIEELSQNFEFHNQKQKEDAKPWNPPKGKPNKREFKAFMQKLLKDGDAKNKSQINKEKTPAQSVNLFVDI